MGSWQRQSSGISKWVFGTVLRACFPAPGMGSCQEMRGELMSLQELICLSDGTGCSCSCAWAGSFCPYPWGWSSPASQSPCTPERAQCKPCKQQGCRIRPGLGPQHCWDPGEMKHPSRLADWFTCAYYLCQNEPWEPEKQVNIYAYLICFAHAPFSTLGWRFILQGCCSQ